MIEKTNNRIFQFLIDAHQGQNYNEDCYLKHLVGVMALVITAGYHEKAMIQAALGHDVLEDTNATEQDLLDAGFIPEAVELIKLLTDKPGKNRAERHRNTYPLIATNWKARIIKICDRSFNVYHSSDKLKGMYRKEHEYFYNTLYRCYDNDTIQEMWDIMEEILFGKA